MLSAGMKYFTEIPLSVAGMLIFFIAFLAASFWTFRVRSSKFYQQMAEQAIRQEGE